ncbi:uncharacterized protein LOC131024399 [Salvia miltiorrhiza]|uniref:uncharacterized protein LOC131024399 n=1 Tax=Salvia miltiorrhiza TaxID=226208 RepID=UPI0025AD2227|nr:uncharacterized protein LOC131024399 [Salvia miltiorrhiza]
MPAFSKLQQGISQFYSPFLNHISLTNKIAKSLQFHPLTLISLMVTASASTKRPTCPSCSKPASICLCSRLRTPLLHNSVSVTIFQHSLEKNHPLNSARIAKIGLKNVNVVTVSDVNFEAQFFIRPLKVDESCHLFDEMPSKGRNDEFLETANLGADYADLEGRIMGRNEFNVAETSQLCQHVMNLKGSELSAFDFTIAKSGTISSMTCKMGPAKIQEMSFDQLLASDAAVDEIRKGFVVKKVQVSEAFGECEEVEEFEIAVPCGSVLLFPTESSVDVEAIEFEVKNLIVLDGTWAKAKRMYKENPWLRLLPHLRLDIDKSSLYEEVRTQPRAGYLSTIESIVYAMKAVGEEEADGLDGLLDVFESMVGDQRRCKDERMSKVLGK